MAENLSQAERRRNMKSRARAGYANAYSERFSKASLAPEAWRLRHVWGMRVPAIAKALHRSDRYIRDLLKWYRENGTGTTIVFSDPKQLKDLTEEDRALVWPRTADAFEAFYERFSGWGFPPHWKSWVEAALENRLLLLNVPPRHGKSTCMSVWFPIWLIAGNRDEQILIVSKTDRLAQKFTDEISY